jgi:PAS domain S-box-containing protein
MKSDHEVAGAVGELESQIRSTLENLLEGAQIIDRDWRYVYVSRTAARHGGRSVEELVGRTMMEVYPGIEETEMFRVLRQTMETAVSAEMQNEFVLPDGTHKWFQLLIQRVPEGVFVLSLDVTERKEAEEELRTTRARLEAIIENLEEGLVLSDLHGNLVHWNRAAMVMLGLSSSGEGPVDLREFASKFQLFTLDGAEVQPEEQPLAKVIRGERFRDVEYRLVRPDQQWERTLSYNGAIVHYGAGESAAVVTIRDVTERKQLERQFIRVQRMESIGVLAAGIAHDLNNVLMPILMGTGLLRGLTLGERDKRVVDNIERSARRGADLVKQVLSLARGSTTDWTAIDVRVVVADIEAMIRRTFPKYMTIAAEVPAGHYLVLGDRDQLVQAILNICVHARDAMPKGGQLAISMGLRVIGEEAARTHGINAGRYVAIEIVDEGLGIPREVLEHVFEPFGGNPDSGTGGLGLFSSQEIARAHGGFVDVASETGKGTTFRLFLPAEGDDAANYGAAAIPRGSGQLILVVDDEISIVSVLQQTLEAYGYEVVVAEDGAQAVAIYAARRARISLVLTDMVMPVMDGAALVAALFHMNPHVPVIVTSGTCSHDWKVRAERAGARHFLAKPYTSPALLRMVAAVLAGEP